MKIIEMTATFGCLSKATLRPGPGFTLIQAPNESGKSTWCAFLRAMLYGFPARDRNSGGYIAEKNRYQPWSGAAMEGSLRLEWKGREVTLYRGPKGNVPWGSFSAVWTATNEPVEGLAGENCGEMLLGVSREVFERTAFVGQGGASLSPSADLEKRIAALATSGEEDVSYSQVERRLKDWLNRRKVNSRVGLIPELTEELSQVEGDIARQGSLLRQAQAAQREKETLETRRLELESQLRTLAAADAAEQAEKRKQAQADCDAARAALRAAETAAQALPPAEVLRQAQGDVAYLTTLAANLKMAEKAAPEAREKVESAEQVVKAATWFAGLDPFQANSQAQKDYETAKRGTFSRGHLLLPLVNVLIAILLAYGWLTRRNPVFAILWGITATCWLVSFFLRRQRNKARQTILARYQVDSPEDILDRAAAYQRDYAAAQEAARTLQNVETEAAKLTAQRKELAAQLLALVKPFAPEVTDQFGVSAALSRALQQGEAVNLAKARAEAAERLLAALPPAPSVETPLLPVQGVEGDLTQVSAQLSAVRGELARASDAAAHLMGELKALGDPAELEARRDALREQLALRQGEYDAIAAAMESLKAADNKLRERFSPAVNQRSGEFLSALTGGKYDKAALTRQFQALAQEEGETAPRQDLTLSAGTAEQLYLAVRLAMCELALPTENPCPIVLDDVLDPFDDHRAKLALDCLLDLSEKRQVLLFSCHSREKEMLDGTDAAVLAL